MAAQDWPAFTDTVRMLRRGKADWPADLSLVKKWYEPHLLRIYDDGHLRAPDIQQLEQIASGYRSRQQFLTDLALDPPDATSGKAGVPILDEDYLILSTIHSAKGREWRVVRILNVVDGCIPSSKATGTQDEIEEERRLLYVAMTRAKNKLDLVVPQRSFISPQREFDNHTYTSVSRFIPESIRDAFEQRHWHDHV